MNLDAFTMELIKGDEELRKAYVAAMIQEMKVRELSAKSNYNALKIKVTETKNKERAKPEQVREAF